MRYPKGKNENGRAAAKKKNTKQREAELAKTTELVKTTETTETMEPTEQSNCSNKLRIKSVDQHPSRFLLLLLTTAPAAQDYWGEGFPFCYCSNENRHKGPTSERVLYAPSGGVTLQLSYWSTFNLVHLRSMRRSVSQWKGKS